MAGSNLPMDRRNVPECPLGGALSTGQRRPTSWLNNRESNNFSKDVNLDGKIPIDPILGLPDEHGGLFLIRFYTELEILPKEKDLQQRVRELRDVLLRDVPARCRPKTQPIIANDSALQARPCGDAGSGSQHPGRLAPSGREAERPSVANPTCTGNAASSLTGIREGLSLWGLTGDSLSAVYRKALFRKY